MATFSDQIESIMKGFMDDFSVSRKNSKNTLRIWIRISRVAKKHTLP